MFFLLIVIVAFYTIVPMGLAKGIDMYKQKIRGVGGLATAMILLVAMFATSMVLMLQSNEHAVADAKSVAIIPIDENSRSVDARLYYDESANEYFTITIDWVNPIRPTCRYHIGEEVAKKYIGTHNVSEEEITVPEKPSKVGQLCVKSIQMRNTRKL